jgi:hypothetical protein
MRATTADDRRRIPLRLHAPAVQHGVALVDHAIRPFEGMARTETPVAVASPGLREVGRMFDNRTGICVANILRL